MKKQIMKISALAVAFALYSSNAFAFTSTQVSNPITARANTGGTVDASFDLELRLASDPEGSAAQPRISWVNVNPGSGWDVAQEVMRITWDVTDANGGVQIYTNNTLATASPQFADPTPLDPNNSDSNPAGLVLGLTGQSGTTLPMAWSIKGSSSTPPTQANPAHTGLDPAGNPDPNVPTDVNAFQWLFLQDKATPPIDFSGDGNPDTTGFTDGDAFATMIKLAGVHFGQGPAEFAPDADKLAYVYFQADFTTAGAQADYQTSTLTVEAFIE